MEPKEIVRYLTSPIEERKEILNIAYNGGLGKGKKIEAWITKEMLAKLLELKEKKIVNECEGEHKYHLRKIKYPPCDLWWKKADTEHWLEVKTLTFHENSKVGLKDDYEDRITKDLDRIENLGPIYVFHHLLIVFDDNNYENGNWKEDVYSIYDIYDLKKEDKWIMELDEKRILHLFLHFKTKEAN